MRRSMRSRTLPLLLAAVALAGCGDREDRPARIPTTEVSDAALYGAPAEENLRVVPVEVEVENLPDGWDGMRIAAISDFNLGLWEGNARVAAAAVRTALAQRPDVVVLLGDYIARGEHLSTLERILAPLRGRLTLAVLGDRDKREEGELQGAPDSAAMRLVQTLQRSGVVVLNNERGRLVRGGDTAYIAGLDPYVARKPEWRQAEIFASIPRTSRTPVLLSHMPAAVYAAPDSTYPLVLSGHTFCGRVEVPGTPRLSWVNTELIPSPSLRIPGTDRLYRVDGNGLFITCGVGYGFVPVRLGAPPEVALITLRRVGPATPADTTRRPSVDSLLQQYEQTPVDATGADTTAARDTTAGRRTGT
ncbi:MAG: metallophosphoesterase [Gemmatimonadota bacterium]|nr:metallophosphoesterase [Gemmatimonadota bacterium]